ncbi:MAG TPA: hypothetical protein VK048_04745 [Atopostipes sp.]|nr:hypothetical protein [Atopostipes sp.]
MKDKKQLQGVVNEEVTINQIKGEMLEGIDSLIEIIALENEMIASLELIQILSHDKEGSAHGVVTFDSGHQKHFAEFYQFESTKKEARIKSITQ